MASFWIVFYPNIFVPLGIQINTAYRINPDSKNTIYGVWDVFVYNVVFMAIYIYTTLLLWNCIVGYH